MGTNGAWGFVLNGSERITYNHFDSYPDGLGADLLAWARQADWDKVREQVMDLTLVDESASPTEDERAQVAEYADSSVSTGGDWYSALRKTQGDPENTLRSGFMTDASDFPMDSLFCEYAYLFNLDDGTFEVYQGFQKSRPTCGHWAGRPTPEEESERYAQHVAWCAENGRDPWFPEESEYKAVRLWEVWPLHDLPTAEQYTERLVGDPE